MRSLIDRARGVAAAHPQVAALLGALAGALVVWAVTWLARDVLPGLASGLLFVPLACAAAAVSGAWAGLAAGLIGFVAVASMTGLEHAAAYALTAALSGVSAEFLFRRQRHGRLSADVLSEREARLRSIYDTAPDGLIVIDEHGVVQTYNAAAERIFGWAASEVLGRNVGMLMAQPQRGEHDQYIKRYLDSGERRIIGIGRTVTGVRKDGATFPIELAVGEVRSEKGRFFTGFLRDLTERQATETRLKEMQAELVHMSRFLAMGEMASALAHELNQPLSAISNYVGGGRKLLERTEGDPRAIEALDKAADQALRAGEIIRRLREFLARGEGERVVAGLPKLVQEACALALVGAKENGVAIRYDFDPGVEQVLVDRVQIQQVIVNLVRNSLDAMENSDRRQLVVSTASDGQMAMISVSDTGPGLSEAAAARLFQPFVTTKPQGMGVGLSISRTIVEAHGGRIWTEPNPEGGAVFRFTVRRAPEEQV